MTSSPLFQPLLAPGGSAIDDALRELHLLAIDPDLPLDDKVDRLLQLGLDVLGLSLGLVSRIRNISYEVIYSAGDGAPPAGTYFDVRDTYCLHTLEADTVTGFHEAGTSHIRDHPCYRGFGLEAYIGVPLVVDGDRVGTLNFSRSAARQPFSDKEIALVGFFGRWLSHEWHRRDRADELARHSALFAKVFDAAPDALVVSDPGRRILRVNKAAERLFGCSAATLETRQLGTLVADAGDGDATRSDSELASPGMSELRLQRRDGTTFEGEVIVTPLATARGSSVGGLAAIRDVTDRKAQDQLKTDLISTIGHELRTPVTVILGALGLLETSAPDNAATHARLLGMARRGAERLDTLLKDILDLERLDYEPRTLASVDLAELLSCTAEALQPYAQAKKVRLRVEAASMKPAPVPGRESRLRQVLENLVTNAVKASEAGSEVTLGLMPEGDGFWVRDRGKGIPVDLQPILFDRFTRSENSYSGATTGSGLGMSIVKSIVDHHFGAIRFDTDPAEGTRFEVTFPTTLAAEDTGPPPREARGHDRPDMRSDRF